MTSTTTIAMNPAVASTDVTVPFYTTDSITFEMLSSTGYSTLLSNSRPVATDLTINSTSGRLNYTTSTYYLLEVPLDEVSSNLVIATASTDRLWGWNYFSFGYTSTPALSSYNRGWYLCYYEADIEFDSSSNPTGNTNIRFYFPSTTAYNNFCTGTYFAINYVAQSGAIVTTTISYTGIPGDYQEYTAVSKSRNFVDWTGGTTNVARYYVDIAGNLDSQESFQQTTYSTRTLSMTRSGTTGVYLVGVAYKALYFPNGEWKYDSSANWFYTFTSRKATTKVSNLFRPVLNYNREALDSETLPTFNPRMIIPSCTDNQGTFASMLKTGVYDIDGGETTKLVPVLRFSFINSNLVAVTLQSITVTPMHLTSLTGKDLSKTWTYSTDYSTTLTARGTTTNINLEYDDYFTTNSDTQYWITFTFNVPDGYNIAPGKEASTYTTMVSADYTTIESSSGTATITRTVLKW